MSRSNHIMSRGLSKGESQIPTVMILSQTVHLVCTRKFNSGMAIMKNWLWYLSCAQGRAKSGKIPQPSIVMSVQTKSSDRCMLVVILVFDNFSRFHIANKSANIANIFQQEKRKIPKNPKSSEYLKSSENLKKFRNATKWRYSSNVGLLLTQPLQKQ